MRRTLAAWCTMMLAAWLLGAAPAAAQDAPIPRIYPTTFFDRASTYLTPDEIARDQAAADGHEAACNRADMAGCGALGTAFETGTGRTQSRPVAELLYREACTGGLAEGCFRLGQLLRYADSHNDTPGDLAVSAELFVRACRMGSAAGCEAKAAELLSGVVYVRDPEAALSLLRTTCDSGSAGTCSRLAAMLMQQDRSAEQQAEGLALLDRQCRARESGDCRTAARYWQQREEEGASRRMREYLALGCAAGDASACTERGTLAVRNGIGPEARSAGIAYFESACALEPRHCDIAATIRDEPQLIPACGGGDNVACERLATAYADEGGPLENLPQAADLFGWRCDRAATADEAREVCTEAGVRAVGFAANPAENSIPPDPARIDSFLTRACTAGSESACNTLSDQLASGTILPLDMPRALALYEAQCDNGSFTSCGRLQKAIFTEAAAPLLEVSGDTSPPPEYSPEELAEMRREYDERAAAIKRNLNENACTTTEVTFRGVTYTDTICAYLAAMLNAFDARVGSAPWQAILWRPERVNGKRLKADRRVLCGGAVIRTGWVLTAAHCLTDPGGVAVLTGGHTIRLGVFDQSAPEGYEYPILRVIPHPNYRRKDFAFDVALIQYDPARGKRLGEVVHKVARIRVDPLSMEARTIRARMPAFSFGWGRTALDSGAAPPKLQAARLELRDTDNCTRITNFRDEMRNAVLCAAGPKGEQACMGDSGGALISYDGADKVPTVIGVVSAGVKCGTTGVPSRFTRIAHPLVRDWLNSIVPPATRR
ncbi:MAG: hypothetical protein EDM03_13480 [Porphyrobacter sp. IPPAS B-1204]|nr:MAG: hypothetical protein EDM03_13480 [Porphyrobacter sp. IPPAS B-1204]